MRMVGLHDEVHKLGNEIRDRNVVVRDLQAKIDWNQYRIKECVIKRGFFNDFFWSFHFI